jgi:heat-inducible transcriptional repressor
MADPQSNPLDDRKEHILREIVEGYVRRGEPVGSKIVADAADLGVSSATIRNEMAILEREGYISHPHTSAGRIPTDKGYRYYVDVLATKVAQEPQRRREIQRNLAGTFSALEELLERTSQLLSELTDYTSLAAAPSSHGATLRRIELVRLAPHRLLLICVGDDGWHDDRLIELEDEPSDVVIEHAVQIANAEVLNATPQRGADLIDQAPAPAELRAVLNGVAHGLRAVDRSASRVFTGGAAKLIVWEPVDTAQRVIEMLEARAAEEFLPQPAPNAITVRIGRELALEDVRDLSLIATGYTMGNRTGSLGILGPTRMDYPQVISTVAEVASTLTRVLRQLGT